MMVRRRLSCRLDASGESPLRSKRFTPWHRVGGDLRLRLFASAARVAIKRLARLRRALRCLSGSPRLGHW